MHNLRRLGSIAVICLAPSAGLAQMPCLASGDMVAGRVAPIKAGHPNGSTFTAYIMTLAPPRCVQTEDQRIERVRRLQLGGSAAQQATLQRRASTALTVRIRDPFAPETAWHVGDVIVVDYDIVN